MEQVKSPLKSFEVEGTSRPISFVRRSEEADGVVCDVYSFVDDDRKDLGIIQIERGKKTPLQKVLSGDRTIEGYISGKGTLTVTKQNGQTLTFSFDGKTELTKTVPVSVGETMQWKADKRSKLKVFELCYPPYAEGRFENIETL